MTRYAIGLDIGIASVGFASVLLNENDEPYRIDKMGARIFDAAEHPKTGASLAKPRREARGARRRLRRHQFRLIRIRELLVSENILSQSQLDNLFAGQLEDIYALRTNALDTAVTASEFARILLHLAQRRGFKSNRKSESASKEDGALLSAIEKNKERMAHCSFRTVGEMFYKDIQYESHKRNKAENYLSTVSRDMIADEVHAIFDAQRKANSAFASETFEQAYLDILLSQRSFAEGPGEPSPYAGDQIFKLVGNCTFFEDEKRAAKACYSAEYFNLLQTLNHMYIIKGGSESPLTKRQRELAVSLFHKSAKVSYTQLRKELCMADDEYFSKLKYSGNAISDVEKASFPALRAYHEMRKALDKVNKGRISKIPRAKLNEAGNILTFYKADNIIKEKLTEAGFEEIDINALLLVNDTAFKKAAHLSVKALDLIIPYLEEGLVYAKACESAGIDFKAHTNLQKSIILPATMPEMDSITSPVARRTISQVIKVINAITREMGQAPVYINIELAREMSKDFSERRDMDKKMQENASKNEQLMNFIRTEYKITKPSGQDLIKLKLYRLQGEVCAYSIKHIDASRLFESGYVEIDHIVPYSICFDDSYKNKALVFAEENRQKGCRLPLEYLQGKRREDFIVHTKNTVNYLAKQRLLLKEKITPEDESLFKERNLQDTKTISRFMYNYISDYLAFTPFNSERKRHVTAVNGIITSMLRKRYGLNKVRENGDLHHATDAVVIACTTQGMINSISKHSRHFECEYVQADGNSLQVNAQTGEIKRTLPYPWPQFRKELDARLCANASETLLELNLANYLPEECMQIKPIFVSRMPNRKVTGAAHKDTIKSLLHENGNEVLSKIALTSLKLDTEFYMPNSDTLLYAALKKRLIQFGGDAKAAFAQPFYKPKADGTNGPIVKKVKVIETSTLNVPVHGGTAVAANDSMVRIDVFYVEGDGYYIVPIYVADTLKKVLPSKATVSGKPYSQWKDMCDENFVFSLYQSDLIYITHKTKMELSLSLKQSTLPPKITIDSGYFYYNKTGISSATITVYSHERAYTIASLGVKTLKNMQKCVVDVLGNISFVKKEKRMAFYNNRKD